MRRPLILAAVALTLGWTVAAVLIDPRVFWLAAVLHLGPALVSVAGFVAAALLTRAKPAGFVVRDGVGFLVPASPGMDFLAVGELALLALLTDQVSRLWTWGGTDGSAFHFWAVAAPSAALLASYGLVALLVITALRGWPQILLTPDAVVQQDWWGNRAIRWEALRSAQPVRQARGRNLTLVVDRLDLVVRRGAFRPSTGRPWLNMAYLRVHPRFLADAIWFYTSHPHRRDAIGARTEYERLLAELGVREAPS
jgi:hypothetical protein